MTPPGARVVFFYMHDFSGGGVERMRLRLIRALQERGENVTLVVQQSRGELLAALPAGVELIDLSANSSLAAIPKLAALLIRRSPDFLISSLDHNNIAAAVARMISFSRTRLIVCQHNALSEEAALGFKYRVVPFFYRVLSSWIDGFVAVSEGVRRDLLQRCGLRSEKLTVIYNPVVGDPEIYQRRLPAPHPFLEQTSVPVFVFAGRLVAQKDPLLALQAFARFRQFHSGKMIFLGDGPLRPELHSQVQAMGLVLDVAIEGFVGDVIPWLRRASACVVPSRYEGFANIIVEALACGTPVIAADCREGPAEILNHGEYGRLFRVGDAAGCAMAMAADLRNAFPPTKLTARASTFSITACADAHLNLFDQLGGRPRRSLFGLKFSRLPAGAVAQLVASNRADSVRLVVTPNIDHVRLLRKPDFRQAYDSAAIVCADGFPVALFGWLLGVTGLSRSTGCAILSELLRQSGIDKIRLCFALESGATLEAAKAWRQTHFRDAAWQFLLCEPGLADDNAAQVTLLAQIRAMAPDILIMTLGAPVSEVFIDRHRRNLSPCWALCVGQAFRIELGLTRRAPRWLQGAGLEWLWRIGQEPRRLLPRYLRAAFWFPVAVLADLMHLERG